MAEKPIKMGRWTQIGPRGRKTLFRCECGTEKVTNTSNILAGKSKSCGCLHRELRPSISRAANTKHGGYGTPEYTSWASMIARCHGRKSAYQKNYGGRGITVCKQWRFGDGKATGFECFLSDMGPRGERQSIDRIDPDKNYSPANCRWTTSKVQSRNKRTSVTITVDGKLMNIADAAEQYGLAYQLVLQRIRKWGWDAKRALTTPPQRPYARSAGR